MTLNLIICELHVCSLCSRQTLVIWQWILAVLNFCACKTHIRTQTPNVVEFLMRLLILCNLTLCVHKTAMKCLLLDSMWAKLTYFAYPNLIMLREQICSGTLFSDLSLWFHSLLKQPICDHAMCCCLLYTSRCV